MNPRNIPIKRKKIMKKIKVMSVFGTRPEAIKMAPLVKALAENPQIESICCVTGQHREMLDSVMSIFELKADFDLDIMEKNQTLSKITTKTLHQPAHIQGIQNDRISHPLTTCRASFTVPTICLHHIICSIQSSI